jgi:BirA family biotin operon repressor/biotin-[acetyl-CoA-carboxylase] ligase
LEPEVPKAARVPSLLRVLWYPSVTSTMDVAAEAVRNGAEGGLVIVADEQTAGRGRLGRTWSSPPGAGLYFSIVLRPPLEAGRRLFSLVTLAAGVAVHGALAAATGLASELKWPNDVMIGRRKLAGILAEGSSLESRDQAVVVGIGINVLRSAHPPEVALRATSIEEELGHGIGRDVLLEAVLAGLTTRYSQLEGGDGDGILRAWRTAAPSARGSRVLFSDGVQEGVTAGVDDSGALLVKTARGVERVMAGELRWL